MPNTLKELQEYDEDGNKICSECLCHYSGIEHKCPEWIKMLVKRKKEVARNTNLFE